MSPLFFNKKSTLLFFILCAFPVKRMLYKGSMPATNHVTKVFYAYLIWGKQKGGENVTDFEKLFTDNQGFIFKYLIKLCRDVSLAEELTQETFFRAYVNIKQLADESKAPSWLCRIAKNTYFAWYNKNKRLCPLENAEIPDDTAHIEEQILENELSSDALNCLKLMEEPYKEVFMLYVFGQVPLKEISLMFGESESWARVTFYRSKQKLREMMG